MKKASMIMVTFELPREKNAAEFFEKMNPGYKLELSMKGGVKIAKFTLTEFEVKECDIDG